MYLLYLDDSGSVSNMNEQYFVLGGICVPETSVRWLAHEIEKIAEKISPEDPSQVEFHAATIFSGKHTPWSNIHDKKGRINIIRQVLNSVQPAFPDTVAFACAIHKASYPGQDPVLVAYEQISSRFDMYLQRRSTEDNLQKGLMIIDKTLMKVVYKTWLPKFDEPGTDGGGNYEISARSHSLLILVRRGSFNSQIISRMQCSEDTTPMT